MEEPINSRTGTGIVRVGHVQPGKNNSVYSVVTGSNWAYLAQKPFSGINGQEAPAATAATASGHDHLSSGHDHGLIG